MTKHVGIQTRHARGCPAAADRASACKCQPAYRAEVFDARTGTKIRKTFPTISAAKAWRQDAAGQVRRGQLRAVAPTTLRAAATDWLEQAKAGTVRPRSGEQFKPSTVRGYEAQLERRVLVEFGHRKLSDITRGDLQDFSDRLLADGLDPSTIRNCLMPLRSIYRRALSRGFVAINPTAGLELPAVQGRRERIASPSEATLLLAALPEKDRAVWATALYAGLRRGELMALRFEEVDLARGLIRVERSWDARAGLIEPKSRAGHRNVPIAAVLRDYLDQHKLASDRTEGLMFVGRTATLPFDPVSLHRRATTAWNAENTRRKEQNLDPLQRITLHEARHTFASLMIAAGVNAKTLCVYMGHASITTTLDRYGHLMPGNEEEAAGLLDAYLARADTAARVAQVEAP